MIGAYPLRSGEHQLPVVKAQFKFARLSNAHRLVSLNVATERRSVTRVHPNQHDPKWGGADGDR
jgi:hypothetical protein